MESKTHILSTAPLGPSLVDKAAAEGVQLDAMSFILVEDIINEDDRLEQVERLYRRPVTVVFTSANAVHTVCSQVYFTNAYWKVYCIGHATRTAVLEYFDIGSIRGIANDAAALAAIIRQNGEQSIIFFCGDKRMDTLEDVLQRSGITVQEVVVYRTVETPRFAGENYDGILFFSPSGVDSFFSLNTVPPATVLFAIGNTTASALKKHSDNTILVSELPSKEHLVEKAIQYFKRALA